MLGLKMLYARYIVPMLSGTTGALPSSRLCSTAAAQVCLTTARWRYSPEFSCNILSTPVLGVLTCYYSGKPNADFFLGLAANIALSYYSIVIGLNFACTVLICGRILWVSRRLQQTLGGAAARTYTGAAALMIESMMPYTLLGIAYVATLGVNHPTSILFLSLYIMCTVRPHYVLFRLMRRLIHRSFQCISPQVIMLRVLLGRAWTKETAVGSTMVFRSAFLPSSGGSELTHGGSATAIQLHSFSNAASVSAADIDIHAKA